MGKVGMVLMFLKKNEDIDIVICCVAMYLVVLYANLVMYNVHR